MKYRTTLIDPPWRYPGPGWRGGAHNHYDTIPLEGLLPLPFPSFTADDAHLWLWATDTHWEQALELIPAWGFERKATFEWVKLRKNALSNREEEGCRAKGIPIIEYQGEKYPLAWGNGYYGRACSEFLILATKGRNIVDDKARQVRKVFFSPIRAHSEKPPESYDLIRRYSPGPRLEIFARDKKEGFDLWGEQAPDSVQIPELDEWSRWVKEAYPEKRGSSKS